METFLNSHRFAIMILLAVSSDGLSVTSMSALGVRKLALGYEHSCALFEDYKVKCWGRNNFGQLGLGDTFSRGDEPNEMGDYLPYVDLGPGKIVDIIAGLNNTCAIFEGQQVKCWGDNTYGQLGLGDQINRGTTLSHMGKQLPFLDFGRAILKKLELGAEHTCGLFEDDSVKCWGSNRHASLGIGTSMHDRIGDEIDEMGDSLKSAELGSESRVVDLEVGIGHNCVLFQSKKIKCWGYNGDGAVGNEIWGNVGYIEQSMGDSLPYVNFGDAAVESLFALGFANCVLLDDAKVKCWGGNEFGQVGAGSNRSVGYRTGDMGANLPLLDLGSYKIQDLQGSFQHICAQLSKNRVKCWGHNGPEGVLGLGDSNNRGDQPNEMGDVLPLVDIDTRDFRSLSVGGSNTCLLYNRGQIRCWGANRNGELGRGDTASIGNDRGEMGTAIDFLDLGRAEF